MWAWGTLAWAATRDASGIARLTRTALNGLYDDDTSTAAVECCEFSARRMSVMQPKWFRKYGDVAEGHWVLVAAGNRTPGAASLGRSTTADDGHYTLQYDGDERTTSGVRREAMCLEWQLERSAVALNGRRKRRRGPTGEMERPEMARHIESIATCPPGLPGDTALLFRRDGDGRACRRRGVLG